MLGEIILTGTDPLMVSGFRQVGSGEVCFRGTNSQQQIDREPYQGVLVIDAAVKTGVITGCNPNEMFRWLICRIMETLLFSLSDLIETFR